MSVLSWLKNVGTEKPEVEEISVRELKEMRDKKGEFTLIDVREPEEVAICKLEEALFIPMGELETGVQRLDKQKRYVVHCKMGGRSARAVAFMKEKGFQDVQNLAGGIIAWAEEIDPSMKRY